MFITGALIIGALGAVLVGLSGCEIPVKPREYMPGIIIKEAEDCIKKEGGAKYCVDDMSKRGIKILVHRNPELDEDQLNEWATDGISN